MESRGWAVWPWVVSLTSVGIVSVAVCLIGFMHWTFFRTAFDLLGVILSFIVILSFCKIP